MRRGLIWLVTVVAGSIVGVAGALALAGSMLS